MAWYSTGTINVVNGSALINGNSTGFLNHARFGDALQAPDGKLYEVLNVISDTTLTLTSAYEGVTANAQSFKLIPIQGYVKASADKLAQITGDLADRLASIDQLDQYELSYLNGVTANIQTQLDSKFTGNPTYLADRANHSGTQSIDTIVGLQVALDSKQPLSQILVETTASFTSTLLNKLDGIAPSATANQTDIYLLSRANHTGTQNISTIAGLQTELDNKQPLSTVLTATEEAFTTVLKDKLVGVATGATANATDAQLRDRSTHTGNQAISTVTGLQSALDSKQATLVSGVNIATINGQSLLNGIDIEITGDVVLNGIQTLNGKSGATVNLVPADIGAATAAQGSLADSAVQPATLASTLTNYATQSDLTNGLNTRASAAQGLLASTSLQPGAIEANTYVKRIRTLALAGL